MKLTKVFTLLCLVLAFKSFAQDIQPTNALQNKTEAGFISTCSSCETSSNIFPLSQEKKNCLQMINSKDCKSIPEKDKKTCIKPDSMKSFDTSSFLLQCAKETALSFKFIFDLLWYGLSSSTSWLLNSEQDTKKSSANSYILIEFYKAYLTTKGSKMERAIKSAAIVGKESFNLIWSNLRNFLVSEYKSLKCYNSQAQLSLACVFIAGLFVPIPGSSLLGMLKTGVKAGSKMIKKPKAIVNNLTKIVQINSLKDYMRSSFNQMRSNILKKSKNLTQKNKEQLKEFFKTVNKENLINSVSTKLAQSKNTVLSKDDIRNAIISSLTIGSANIIYLSPKSVAVITEGMVDTLSAKYVSEELM